MVTDRMSLYLYNEWREKMDKSTVQIRGLIALGMLILIVVMIITGVLLWLATLGVMNNPVVWGFASQVHPIIGLVMFVLGMIHLISNKKMFVNDLNTLTKGKKS